MDTTAQGRRVLVMAVGVVLVLVATVAVLAALLIPGGQLFQTQSPTSAVSSGDAAIASAFERQLSDVQVTGEGVVTRTLSDDTEGDRHQRFVLMLASGQTLLVAHNIDIAPRIEGLQAGDPVAFSGVYEYNDQGGLVHWTHHDPDGDHQGGWLRHEGVTYQ